MISSDFNLVLKYCEVLDEFVKIRVFSEDEIRALMRQASIRDKGAFQRAVVHACIVEYNDDLAERLGDIEPVEERREVEEMLYLLCVDVNAGLDIHAVSVEISSDEIADEPDGALSQTARRQSRRALRRVADIDQRIKRSVIGQDRAVDIVTRAVKKAAVGLRDPQRPVGAFLFVGQVGVGKTELAKALAQEIYGTQSRLIRVDCSEYALPHEYAKLIGSPPGYIGHNEGGYLTEAAKELGDFIVLFDEIEKAHSKMHNILLQLLDEGMVTDSKGFKVSFRNALVLMTSNLGVREVEKARAAIGFDHATKKEKRYEEMRNEIFESLKKAFRPEFINRLDDVIVFNTLTLEDSERIVAKMLQSLGEIARRAGVGLTVSDAAKRALAVRGYKKEYGARELRRTLKRCVEEPLTDMLLAEDLVEGNMVSIDVDGDDFRFEVIDIDHALASEPR